MVLNIVFSPFVDIDKEMQDFLGEEDKDHSHIKKESKNNGGKMSIFWIEKQMLIKFGVC